MRVPQLLFSTVLEGSTDNSNVRSFESGLPHLCGDFEENCAVLQCFSPRCLNERRNALKFVMISSSHFGEGFKGASG